MALFNLSYTISGFKIIGMDLLQTTFLFVLMKIIKISQEDAIFVKKSFVEGYGALRLLP